MSKKNMNTVNSNPETSNIILCDLGYKVLEVDTNVHYEVVSKPCDMLEFARFTNLPETVDAPTHFSALQMALNGRQGVTMTSKNIRIYIAPKIYLMCWRRANYIRVYTTTPEQFKGVEWVEYNNPNETVTHVAHLTYNQVIELIKNR